MRTRRPRVSATFMRTAGTGSFRRRLRAAGNRARGEGGSQGWGLPISLPRPPSSPSHTSGGGTATPNPLRDPKSTLGIPCVLGGPQIPSGVPIFTLGTPYPPFGSPWGPQMRSGNTIRLWGLQMLFEEPQSTTGIQNPFGDPRSTLETPNPTVNPKSTLKTQYPFGNPRFTEVIPKYSWGFHIHFRNLRSPSPSPPRGPQIHFENPTFPRGPPDSFWEHHIPLGSQYPLWGPQISFGKPIFPLETPNSPMDPKSILRTHIYPWGLQIHFEDHEILLGTPNLL